MHRWGETDYFSFLVCTFWLSNKSSLFDQICFLCFQTFSKLISIPMFKFFNGNSVDSFVLTMRKVCTFNISSLTERASKNEKKNHQLTSDLKWCSGIFVSAQNLQNFNQFEYHSVFYSIEEFTTITKKSYNILVLEHGILLFHISHEVLLNQISVCCKCNCVSAYGALSMNILFCCSLSCWSCFQICFDRSFNIQ